MYRNFLKVGICAIFFSQLLMPLATQAQDENDLVKFLQAGPEDASKLMNAYLDPVMSGLSYGFNGGWFTTAKAHKPLGFDIGVSVNAVFIPSSENYFNPADLDLQTITSYQTTAPNGLAPTLGGPDYQTTYSSEIDINDDGRISDDEQFTFEGPQGIDLKNEINVNAVAAPTAQIGIGIYKNTDLKIRWVPEIETGETKVKLIGFGIMHDIKQHIPGLKLLPFDLSVLAGYTKISGSSALDGTFDTSPSDPRAQQIDYEMNAWLFQALISKKIAVVTFYGGVGYNTVKTTSDVTGSYVVYDNPNTPSQDLVFRDPISLSFKNKSMRLTGGMRLNLAVFYINLEYTLQEYQSASLGLGFTFR